MLRFQLLQASSHMKGWRSTHYGATSSTRYLLTLPSVIPTLKPLIFPRQKLNITRMSEPTVMRLSMYEYNATWSYLNGVLHKSLPSMIPTLQPPKWCCFIDFITHTKVFFYLSYLKLNSMAWVRKRTIPTYRIRYSNYSERKVGDCFFPELLVNNESLQYRRTHIFETLGDIVSLTSMMAIIYGSVVYF
jgi:hypothetical protein